MKIYSLSTGDELHKYNEALVMLFAGKRNVLSTALYNGGYTENLAYVFNHKSGYGYCKNPQDAPMSYEEYITDYIENKLDLDIKRTTWMATIVSMDNACIETATYKDITVTAIATASLEVNGGRVCDPAEYYEEKGKPNKTKVGTINIMLHVNVNMTPGCMARSIVTLTEAKTAAIQELLGSSLYSHGIATGSGSDSVIVISNPESDYTVTYSGKHGKLGEMIGVTVKTAVKKALGKHMNLTEKSQHSMEKRTFRYGLTKEHYWETFKNKNKEKKIEKHEFINYLDTLDTENKMVTLTSLYIHLLDQFDWGLLSSEEVHEGTSFILEELSGFLGIKWTDEGNKDKTIEDFVTKFSDFMALVGEMGVYSKGSQH